MMNRESGGRRLSINRVRLLFVALLLAILVGDVIATHNAFTAPFPGHNDFLSRWEGARSYWLEGLNPYGDEASLNIQERIFGRAVVEGEDPGFFAYPFYTVFLVWPLVYMDYAWASAIWMVLLEVSLVGAFFLLLDLFAWRPKPPLLGALTLFMLVFYFSTRGLLLGQPGHVVYLLEVLALWALVKDRDRLAGVVLAVSTIKPQMGFLLVPFLLLWALHNRRWPFVASFSVTFGIFIVVSFLLLPSWMGDWLYQVGLYPSYTALGGPIWILGRLPYLTQNPAGDWIVNPGLGPQLELLGDAILYGLMLWSWYDVLVKRREERWLWTVVWTLMVTHLVAPRTATPHFVVFIIALIFYFREITARDQRNGNFKVLALLALLFILPWIHFLATVEGEFEHPTLYLPLPFLMAIVLWWTRRLWWGDVSSSDPAADPSDANAPSLESGAVDNLRRSRDE